jgi:adenylate cyclase
MIDCIEKTGGVVDKFIGDAVMAHWGTAYTAGSPEKDACNCVMAALMMRKALYEMNKKREPGDPGNPPIRIGCGINTGMVTAGQLGSDRRMEYTAIGDPVNLASRTEALNKPLGTDILITEDTWRLVKNYFITEEMPPVTVKGKEKPVRIFAVVNSVKIDKGPRTLAEVRKLLGIEAPDISKVDVNADEKKYKIGAEG